MARYGCLGLPGNVWWTSPDDSWVAPGGRKVSWAAGGGRGAQRGQQCAGSLTRGHATMAERADSLMCVKCVGAVIQSHNASVGRDWESARSRCDCEHHYPSCGVGLLSLSCIWYTICVKILDVYRP